MFFWIVGIVFLAALAYVRFAPSDPVRWHVEPKIEADGQGMNSVRRRVFTGPDGLRRFDRAVGDDPRTEILAGSVADGMITLRQDAWQKAMTQEIAEEISKCKTEYRNSKLFDEDELSRLCERVSHNEVACDNFASAVSMIESRLLDENKLILVLSRDIIRVDFLPSYLNFD